MSDLSDMVAAGVARDSQTIKYVCSKLEKDHPNLWKLALPRRVVSPPGYIRHEYQAMVAVASAVQLQSTMSGYLSGKSNTIPGLKLNIEKGNSGALQAKVEFSSEVIGNGQMSNASASARALTIISGNGFQWPSYYLDKDLFKALSMTAPPDDMKISEIKWPLDFFSLFLPMDDETRKITCGRQVPVIWVSRMEPTFNMSQYGGPVVAVSFSCFEKLKDGSEVMVDYGAVIKESSAISSIHTGKKDFRLLDDYGDSEDFLSKMVYLAISAAMVMTSRPKLIENGTIQRREKRSKSGKLEVDALWSPNIIGRLYRHGLPQGGTHCSPRAHWRSGHWRRQFYGPRPWTSASPFELIWLDPIWVDPE